MTKDEALKIAVKLLIKLGVIQMEQDNIITINGVEYVRSDSIQAGAAPITGSRAIVVVDRGWIFAGDVTRENGRIKLSRALHVFKWASIGFAKMVETANADLRPIADLDIPEDSEIFSIPVEESWGL